MKPLDQRSIFGRNLFLFRRAKHLGQQELAQLTGIGKPLIAAYETQVIDPPASNLLILSKALGVTVNDLLYDHPEPSPEDFMQLDPRFTKKIRTLLKLSRGQKTKVYRLIDALAGSPEEQDADDQQNTIPDTSEDAPRPS